MAKKVEKLFEALFALIDARQIFRDTAPKHNFNKEQKAKLKNNLKAAKKAIEDLEAGLNED